MELMSTQRHIGPGIYLVIDPSMEKTVLYDKLDAVLEEGIAAVQIWDHFRTDEDIPALTNELCQRCHAQGVPVLINNQWTYLADTPLDGVHFDAIPRDYETIKTTIGRQFLCGITCTNIMEPVQWASDHRLDYISFCSMFPSTTVDSCELVTPESVHRAKAIYGGPIFLAGGIRPENIGELNDFHYHGIAVISGVMNSDSPGQSIQNYHNHMR